MDLTPDSLFCSSSPARCCSPLRAGARAAGRACVLLTERIAGETSLLLAAVAPPDLGRRGRSAITTPSSDSWPAGVPYAILALHCACAIAEATGSVTATAPRGTRWVDVPAVGRSNSESNCGAEAAAASLLANAEPEVDGGEEGEPLTGCGLCERRSAMSASTARPPCSKGLGGSMLSRIFLGGPALSLSSCCLRFLGRALAADFTRDLCVCCGW